MAKEERKVHVILESFTVRGNRIEIVLNAEADDETLQALVDLKRHVRPRLRLLV